MVNRTPETSVEGLRLRARERHQRQAGRGGSAHHTTRVLVVGPVGESGGMGRVARMTTHGLDPERFAVAVCDTAKDTPPDRSVLAACWSHLRRAGRLIRQLRRHRPAFAHIHTCSYHTFHRTILDTLICRCWKTPFVLHVHGGLFEEYLRGLAGWRRRVALDALHRADRVIVLGETWRSTLQNLVPRAQFTVIPNAIDISAQADDSAPRGAGILFVGDLSEVKRPEDALVTFAALPSELRRRHPLTIVGGGSADRSRQLAKLAHRLDVERDVRFLGPQSHDSVGRLMASADLLLMTSRAEGMPLVLLEAMAAGLPIVATRVGAVPEMLEHDVYGMLAKPGDTLAMALTMKRLLKNESKRADLARAARERVEDLFSVRRFHVALEDLWTDVANQHSRPVPTPIPRLAATSLRSIL